MACVALARFGFRATNALHLAANRGGGKALRAGLADHHVGQANGSFCAGLLPWTGVASGAHRQMRHPDQAGAGGDAFLSGGAVSPMDR